MSCNLKGVLVVSSIFLVSSTWVPASAQTRKSLPRSFFGCLKRFVKDPGGTWNQLGRDNMAKQLRAWRSQGLKVVKVGPYSYMTYARRKRVDIPDNDFKGWLKSVGGEGALSAARWGEHVQLRKLENTSWKLKAAIPVRPGKQLDYDLPNAINIGYDSSKARRFEGRRLVYCHADLRFTGKPNARQRVGTNISIRDLDGDITKQKKSKYLALELDLPKDKVHANPLFNRVTLSATMLNPNTLIATTGHISGNQVTDQVSIYARE
jgi:hypothetical protein